MDGSFNSTDIVTRPPSPKIVGTFTWPLTVFFT
jgi:hypothetical protein